MSLGFGLLGCDQYSLLAIGGHQDAFSSWSFRECVMLGRLPGTDQFAVPQFAGGWCNGTVSEVHGQASGYLGRIAQGACRLDECAGHYWLLQLRPDLWHDLGPCSEPPSRHLGGPTSERQSSLYRSANSACNDLAGIKRAFPWLAAPGLSLAPNFRSVAGHAPNPPMSTAPLERLPGPARASPSLSAAACCPLHPSCLPWSFQNTSPSRSPRRNPPILAHHLIPPSHAITLPSHQP